MIERLAIFKCPICSEGGDCPSLDLSMYIEHYARRHMSNFHLYECRQCTKKFATAFVASYHIKMGKCRKEEGELWDDRDPLLNTVPIEKIDCSYLYALQSGINEAIRFMLKASKSFNTISTQTAPTEAQNGDEMISRSSSSFGSSFSGKIEKQSNELESESNIKKKIEGTEHAEEQRNKSISEEYGNLLKVDFNSRLNVEEAEDNRISTSKLSSSPISPCTHPPQIEPILDEKMECQNSVQVEKTSDHKNKDLDVKLSSCSGNIRISPQQISCENVLSEQSSRCVLPSAEEAVLKQTDWNKTKPTDGCNGEDEYLHEETICANDIKVSSINKESSDSVSEINKNDASKGSKINPSIIQGKKFRKCQNSGDISTSQVPRHESVSVNKSKLMSLLDCNTYTYLPQENFGLSSSGIHRTAPLNGPATHIMKRKITDDLCYKEEVASTKQIRRRPTLLDEPKYSRYAESQLRRSLEAPDKLFSYHDNRTVPPREERFDAPRKNTRSKTPEWDKGRTNSPKNIQQAKESKSLPSKIENWRKNRSGRLGFTKWKSQLIRR